jgi:hypothetical protein
MPSGTAVFSLLWCIGGLTGPMLAGAAMGGVGPARDGGDRGHGGGVVALVNAAAVVRAGRR